MKLKILFIISLSLLGCTTPQPISQSHLVTEPLDQIANRVHKLADRCWSQSDGFFKVGRIIEIRREGYSHIITADFYSSDIGRTRFLDVKFTNSSSDVKIEVTEYYRKGSLTIIEKWIQGSQSCHEDLWSW